MTHQEYVKWLQGYVDITGGKYPSKEEWKIITSKLSETFVKVTPQLGGLKTEDIKFC
jgi:hypothetical protein